MSLDLVIKLNTKGWIVFASDFWINNFYWILTFNILLKDS